MKFITAQKLKLLLDEAKATAASKKDNQDQKGRRERLIEAIVDAAERQASRRSKGNRSNRFQPFAAEGYRRRLARLSTDSLEKMAVQHGVVNG